MTNSQSAQGIGKLCKGCNKPPSDVVVFGNHKYTLTNGSILYVERSTCKSCEAKLARDYMASNKDKRAEAKKKHREKYYGTIRYHVQEKISTWRKASCVPSNLTVDYLIDLYEQQDGYCFYSNEKMIFGWVDGKVHHNSLSLDKLDPAKGYVQGNVVWCTYLINTMKQDMTERQFYKTINQIFETTYGVSMTNEVSIADKLRKLTTNAWLGKLPEIIEQECAKYAKQGKTNHTQYFTEPANGGIVSFWASLGMAATNQLNELMRKKHEIGTKAHDNALAQFIKQIVDDLEKETKLSITFLDFTDLKNAKHYTAPTSVALEITWK